LIGRQGQLFYVRGNYHISHYGDPWGAIGSGEEIALGALAMAGRLGFLRDSPTKALTQVLKIVSKISRDVGGDLTLIETTQPDTKSPA